METETKNEIQKNESPLMAAAALVQKDGNMDVGKLKELLEVQERWEANEAKKAYVQAMSAFKANPPDILKDKHVSHPTKTGGQKEYNHATLHNVTTTINSELSKYGLTASWVTSQDNGSVKVTCKITHIMGHSEETCLSAPPEVSGGKNPIQAIGSTVTYLQRYTLLALTGLATHDQDDDGAGSGDKPKPKPKQQTKDEKRLEWIGQLFFNYTTENKNDLAEGFEWDEEAFTRIILEGSPKTVGDMRNIIKNMPQKLIIREKK